jgi:hypothetical protein
MTRHVHSFAGHIQPNLLETTNSSLTGHVRPLAWTYPADQTCLISIPDMSDSRVLGYFMGLHIPSYPRLSISSPLHLLWPQGALKAILDLLHQIPSILREFASPNPCDLQTLVGILSPKLFSRILQDFFFLH